MAASWPEEERLPTVLILGGITTVARPLALYLLGDEKRLASFIRIADKFSINPPTTYLDYRFLDLLKTPELEYRQCNLSSTSNHPALFTWPADKRSASSEGEGSESAEQGFDMVFDLTGEIASDRPELTQISNTHTPALSLAHSASRLPISLKPKAYVRLTFPFYEMKSLSPSARGYAEDAMLRPDGVRGRWWHEALRGIGALEALNTGVLRCGAWYGRGTWEGEIVPRVVVGHVYKHLNEEMKFLHNADLRIHTVHTTDVAQALYLYACYLTATPRPTVLKELGVDLPYSFAPEEKSGFSLGKDKRTSIGDAYKSVKTVVPANQKVVVPLLNVVDDGDSTQDSLGRCVADLWRLKYGFLNSTVTSLVEKFAKTSFQDMVDDVNEKHVEAWSKMLTSSTPPIDSTPITPYLDEFAFRKRAICLDGSKAKRILGFKPKYPKVDVEELRGIVKGFQDDGIWPKTS